MSRVSWSVLVVVLLALLASSLVLAQENNYDESSSALALQSTDADSMAVELASPMDDAAMIESDADSEAMLESEAEADADASSFAESESMTTRKRGFASKVKRGLKKAGGAIKKGLKKVGRAIKKLFGKKKKKKNKSKKNKKKKNKKKKKMSKKLKKLLKKLGKKLKKGAKKVGASVKKAAKKLGRLGAKLAAALRKHKKKLRLPKINAKKKVKSLKRAVKKMFKAAKKLAKRKKRRAFKGLRRPLIDGVLTSPYKRKNLHVAADIIKNEPAIAKLDKAAVDTWNGEADGEDRFAQEKKLKEELRSLVLLVKQSKQILKVLPAKEARIDTIKNKLEAMRNEYAKEDAIMKYKQQKALMKAIAKQEMALKERVTTLKKTEGKLKTNIAKHKKTLRDVGVREREMQILDM